MLVLRDYQSKAIDGLRNGFREGHIRQVLSAPTGAGKSIIVLDMVRSAVEKGSRIIFICERRALIDQFSAHLDREGIDHGVIMAKHWRWRPQSLVQVASAQTLERMETWPSFDVAFIDEVHACFVAGTTIDGKPIEDIKIGDYVSSFNHETGAVEKRRVSATFVHKSDKLVTVVAERGNCFTCTEDHPVFTQNGYVKANSLTHESVLQLIDGQQDEGIENVYTETSKNSSVSSLRNRFSSFGYLLFRLRSSWNANVLRCSGVCFGKSRTSKDQKKFEAKKDLLVKNIDALCKLWCGVFPRIKLCSKFAKEKFSCFLRINCVPNGPQEFHKRNKQGANAQVYAKWWDGKDASQQPHEGRFNQKQSTNAIDRVWSQASSPRWKRSWIDLSSVATSFIFGRRVVGRSLCYYGVQEGDGLPNRIKNRYSKQGKDDCYRSRRSESQRSIGARTGCAEEFSTRPSRVVCVEVQKQGNNVECGTDCERGKFVDVFNIEVEGNHNYFANGVLVHNCLRKSIVTMLETRPKLRVVGATATPFHPLLGKYFTNVVSAPPMVELVGMKNLVPFRVFVAHEIDTDGVKVVAGEWQKDELEDRGRKIVGDIVTDYIQLSQSVFGRRSKAICFSCGIAHGAELVESFAAAGINAIQLASGVDEDFKSDVLRDFAKPDSGIDILISVDMLSRGFDQTDIEHVILARPLKKSFSQHVQMIGRGARSHPGKELCVIQDHCSNWLRFENEWDDFYHNGVNSLSDSPDRKSKKEPSKKEKEAAKCTRCGAFWPSGSDKCLHCGLVRRKENTLAAAPGKMQEISGSTQKKEKYSSDYKESFYKGLIGHLRATGKNENRAFYLYREKFGVDPCWKKEPAMPSMDVINYVKRSNIAFAKRRSA